MGRPLNQFLVEFLSAPSGESYTTLELILKNGQVRRFATDNLTIDGNDYLDYLISADDIEESEEGSTDRAEIILANADKQIGLDIKSGIIHFAQASLGRVFKKLDGTFEWRELFFGEAIPSGYNEKEAKIEIIDDMVAAGYCIANWTLAPVCQLLFKQEYCGYVGSETVCDHLLKGDCTKYANTHRNVSETFPLVKIQNAPVSLPVYQGGGGGQGIIYEDDPLSRFKSADYYYNYFNNF
ncbi:MAG: hypothetical protein KG003_07775 [Bacteroidetes bacterium]|nr:hypothetical protein [Bacteroidota bacterium]